MTGSAQSAWAICILTRVAILRSGEIPVFPGARHVDSKSVSAIGGGAHSGEWAVDAAFAEVVAFYVERLGRPPETEPDGGSKWLFVEDVERPDGKSTARTFVSVKAAPDAPCTLTIGGMSSFEPAKEERVVQPVSSEQPLSRVLTVAVLLLMIATGVAVCLATRWP